MVQIKICGLRSAETVQAAVAAGADFVGLVFFARSPRNVSLPQAAELRQLLPPSVKTVALLVDADDATIEAIMQTVRPDWLQLHGAETPQRVAEIKARSGLPILKAVKVATASDVNSAKDFLETADLLLFDAKPPPLPGHLPGGNGVAFDWSLLENWGTAPFMLSGGLNPANVAEAIKATHAPYVDVSSGVESAPGIKDVAGIRKFIEAARSAR